MAQHHRGPHDAASTRSQQGVDSDIASDPCAGDGQPWGVACVCHHWPGIVGSHGCSHRPDGGHNPRCDRCGGCDLLADVPSFRNGDIYPGYRHRFSHGYQQASDGHLRPGSRYRFPHGHQRAGDGYTYSYSDSDHANVHSDSNHVANGDTHPSCDSNPHAVGDGITNVTAHRAHALPATPAIYLANLCRPAWGHALQPGGQDGRNRADDPTGQLPRWRYYLCRAAPLLASHLCAMDAFVHQDATGDAYAQADADTYAIRGDASDATYFLGPTRWRSLRTLLSPA